MNRLPFALSTIALAILAGCATESGITPAPAPAPVAAAPAPAAAPTPAYVVAPAGTVIVPQAGPAGTVGAAPAAVALRAGFGRVESMQAIPSAAAGGTASNSTRRIVMRMDDGSVQYFDTQAADVKVGDRLEITANGTMRHPA
jgi:hypothetical protein